MLSTSKIYHLIVVPASILAEKKLKVFWLTI